MDNPGLRPCQPFPPCRAGVSSRAPAVHSCERENLTRRRTEDLDLVRGRGLLHRQPHRTAAAIVGETARHPVPAGKQHGRFPSLPRPAQAVAVVVQLPVDAADGAEGSGGRPRPLCSSSTWARSGKPVMCVAMGMVRGLESHPRLRFRGRPGVLSIPVRRAASSASFVSTTHRGVGVQASARLAFGAVMAGRGSGRSRWPGEGRSCRQPGRRRCRRGSYGRFAVPRRGGRALRSDAGCRRGRRSPAHRRRTG